MKSKLITITCLITFFVVANLDLIFLSSEEAAFRDADEAWYGVVLNNLRTVGCRAGIPVTFKFSDRKNFHTCRFFKILNFISPFSNGFKNVIFLKATSKIITILLLFWLAIYLGLPGIGGAFVGTAFFLDPGISTFKPLVGLVVNLLEGIDRNFILSSRFISPLQYMIPGLISFVLMISLIKSSRFLSIKVGCIFLSLFILALTPFYTWVPFLFIYCSLMLFCLYKQIDLKIKYIIAASIIFLIFFVSYVTFSKFGFAYQETAMIRTSFVKGMYHPIFLFHKGFLFILIPTFYALYGTFEKKILPAVIIVLASFLLLNINMLTGRDYQNFHFKDYLGPFIFTFLMFNVLLALKSKKRWILGFWALYMMLGVIYSFKLFYRDDGDFVRTYDHENYNELISFMAKEGKGKKIFCGHLYAVIPSKLGISCFYHHTLFTYPISDEELLEMSVVTFQLLGKSGKKVADILDKTLSQNVLAVWEFGAKKAWINFPNDREIYTKEVVRSIIPEWENYYQYRGNRPNFDLLRGIDFFIMPNSNSLAKQFELVEKFSKYGIYKLIK